MRWRRRSRQEGRHEGRHQDRHPDRHQAPQDRRPGDDADLLAIARARMVREQIEARGLTDPELLQAFRSVPRDQFVESRYAYGDQALPIEEGQTISQPFIVAFMTDAARPAREEGWRGSRVLDVGTGSGYQAAILAELGAEVTSVERYPELSRRAGENLRAAGYPDVQLVMGDGSRGYPDNAPYDAVIVAAAGPSVPPPLIEQLSPDGGKLVIPIGSREHQRLVVVERHGDEVTSREREAVVFVPLIGEHGFGG